jgi:hypothetical protein
MKSFGCKGKVVVSETIKLLDTDTFTHQIIFFEEPFDEAIIRS